MKKRIPLKERIGQRFGYLVVKSLEYKRESNGKRRGFLIVECDCGVIKKIGTDVLYGRVVSCGCRENELKTAHNYTHGLSNTRMYYIYMGMKARCNNPNTVGFHRYGGRGIKVCDEWLESFENFYEWATNNGYQENLTIERIDNDGNYCPDNCKWIKLQEQFKNKDKENLHRVVGKEVLQIDVKSKKVIAIFPSIKKAKDFTGARYISEVLNGKFKSSGGYHWAYAEMKNEKKKRPKRKKVMC